MLNVKLGSALAGLTLCLLTMTVGVCARESLPPGVEAGPKAEGFSEYRLSNGFRVILYPDQAKPTITVNMTYLVGSRHENYGETGMAHLLEHMLFRGSPKHPKLDQEFNQRAAKSNATTGLDRTNYFEVFPASDDNLKWALEMEADRMLNAKVAKVDLDAEMTVVRNEFEEGENSPFGVLFKRMQNIAFDWHNYGKSTIGNRSDIENVRISNLQAFYHTYYQPDNAVLLIAGKFESRAALQWVARHFGKLPRPHRTLPQFWTQEPTQDGERDVIVRRAGDAKLVAVAYRTPGSLHPDSDALSFAVSILADSPNGRLHKALVESGKAVQIYNQDVTGFAPGLQMIGAVVARDQPIEPVREALIAEIEKLATNAPTEEEVERVRRSTANAIEKMINDPQQIGLAMSDAIALGDWRLILQGRDDLAKITPERVQHAAAAYFRRDNRTVGLFIPDDAPQRSDIPPAPTAEQVLKSFTAKAANDDAEAFVPSQDNIEQRTHLKNLGGLKLALLPKRTRGHTVSAAMSLHWGNADNLRNRKMIATLTAQMIMHGTTRFTRAQLADEMDKLKISGDPFHFQTTRDNLPKAIQLMAHALRDAQFSSDEFEQVRKQMLTALESERHEPQALVDDALAAHFDHYPTGDWLAHLSIGQQIEQLKAVRLDEVVEFHRKFYGASHGELALVGDFDEASALEAIEQAYGNWPSASAYAPVTRSYQDVPAQRSVIDVPDKEDGYYGARLALDLGDSDPDFPALAVANYIFGGDAALDSRLMKRIRAKDGLSYGGGSAIEPGLKDRAGSFTIGAIAAPQNLGKVEQAVKEELERVRKHGFTADEVARAKSGLLLQRQQTRAQDGSLAIGWITYLELGRTFAWSKAFEERIARLTPAEVNAAFARAIDTARLTVILASDPAKRSH